VENDGFWRFYPTEKVTPTKGVAAKVATLKESGRFSGKVFVTVK
jgi:hypothetical protein